MVYDVLRSGSGPKSGRLSLARIQRRGPWKDLTNNKGEEYETVYY